MAKLSEAQLAKDLRVKEQAFNQALTACLQRGVVVGPVRIQHEDGTATTARAPIAIAIDAVITKY